MNCLSLLVQGGAMKINTMRDLAATVRGRRLDLGWSQAELARRAKVSREWVNEFEAGKSTVELGLALRVLDSLELTLDVAVRGVATDVQGINLDALLEGYRST